MRKIPRLRVPSRHLQDTFVTAYLAVGLLACATQVTRIPALGREAITRKSARALPPVPTQSLQSLDADLFERASEHIAAALRPRKRSQPPTTGLEPKAAPVVVGLHVRGYDALFAFGEISETLKQPPNGATRFKVCSVTKAFTGVLLAETLLEGRMRLEDSVQSLLPAVKIPRHPAGPIRIEHLADYTSGLPWMPTNFASKSQGGYSDAAWHQFLASYELVHAPGNAYQYGNVGYALLGDVLAAQASIPLETLYHTRIWDPLNMTRSGFIGENPEDRNRAQGLDADGRVVPLDADEPSQPASCAIETTADDLMRFLKAGIDPQHHGAVGRAIAHATTKRHQAGEAFARKLGLGFFLSEDGHLAWKDGAIGGYRSAIGMDVKAQVAAVVLAADERVDATKLMFALMEEAHKPPIAVTTSAY
jgi:serine-type D-Ala-D-Ala carboxypeptidase/endopeptidase